MGHVLAVDTYTTNGELIAAAARLGHLRPDDRVLDATYGKGIWWDTWKPARLDKNDLFDRSGGPDVTAYDYRKWPAGWAGRYDVVAYDPDYGLRGTVNDTNGGYGLDGGYKSVEARHRQMCDGLAGCARVCSRTLLAKCQDQVCCGRLWWQTRMLVDAAEGAGFGLVERLDMLGGDRPQPDRSRWWCLACGKGEKGSVGPRHACRKSKAWVEHHPLGAELRAGGPPPWLDLRPSPQLHARSRPSTLLIFERREV